VVRPSVRGWSVNLTRFFLREKEIKTKEDKNKQTGTRTQKERKKERKPT
jgi:hypothetical protein